jgi:hypothetical protein
MHTQVNVFVLAAVAAGATVCAGLLLFLFPRFTAILSATGVAAFLFVFTRLMRVTRRRAERRGGHAVH